MDKVRFGIIGAGNMGTDHFRNFMNNLITDGECVAIADLVPEKLDNIRKIGEKMNPEAAKKVKYFASGDELIAAHCCDAVVIAIPHYFHPVFAIKALQNGLHAVVEKPAGVYTLQVEEMLDEAKKHPELKLGIMFNVRTSPVFRRMKQMVDEGALGRITRLNWIVTTWFRSQYYFNSGGWRATWKGEGGGVLYNQAPHQIDLFQWIPGMMPCRVDAHCRFGQWHDIEVEDDVTTYVEYPNGATGTFITSTGDTPGTNRFEITMDRAKLVVEGDKLQMWELETAEPEFSATNKVPFAQPKCTCREVETDGKNEQHVGVLNAFAAAILRGEPLVASGEEGINGLTLSNAMHLSAWTGKEVELPFDDELFYEELMKRVKTSRRKEDIAAVTADLSGTYNA